MYLSQQIAAQAVSQVLAGRNLTLALPDALKAYPQATPQQCGGAQDLSYGTLRFYGQLQAVLNQLLEKPLADARIRCLLLVALYQLIHDRADDFTVVNQAVYAASAAKQRWAKGLVNAILRNFLRQKETLIDVAKQTEEGLYAYPQWWISKLKTQYPQSWQAILEAGNQHPPMTLRVNARKTTPQAYIHQLQEIGVQARHLGAQAVMLEKPLAVENLLGFAVGQVSVQDYGAQYAAPLLDLQDGMRVLDACCAPGGKTGHILELANVQLTALDNDATRLKRVASNLARLGLEATLQVGDAMTAMPQEGGLFDRILADVPCTASGIVRRHVDIKWLRRESDIAKFSAQQARILQHCWQLLAKGGKLLYVTCSVFHEENQQQIERFLVAHPDATQLALPVAQLEPSRDHDGLYYALLQKT